MSDRVFTPAMLENCRSPRLSLAVDFAVGESETHRIVVARHADGSFTVIEDRKRTALEQLNDDLRNGRIRISRGDP